MDTWSKVDYSLITPEASMAGCREELLDPPNPGSTTAVDRDIFLEK
jgi:hypothetical protein